jgi:hypothetical protein
VVGAGDPPAEALRRADVAALWRELRRLPRAQRDAFLLRELAGLRYDELAVALSVTEPAVESLLVRARSRLRAQLQRTYGSVAPAFRFLLGNGTSALAAKAAAVGLGAAAVTGGAAPVMLVRHHLRPPAPKRHRVTHERRPAAPPAVPTVAPVLPARVVTTTAVEPERHRGRADERREGSRGFGPPDGRHGSGSSGPGPGDASGEGPGSGGSGSSGSGDSGSSGGRGDDGDG